MNQKTNSSSFKETFECAMATYLDSEKYNKEISEINKSYFSLRGRLLPSEQILLNTIYSFNSSK